MNLKESKLFVIDNNTSKMRHLINFSALEANIFDRVIYIILPLFQIPVILINWLYVQTILMSTHSIGFYEDLTKIIIQLSSKNTHLICSSENGGYWFNKRHKNCFFYGFKMFKAAKRSQIGNSVTRLAFVKVQDKYFLALKSS